MATQNLVSGVLIQRKTEAQNVFIVRRLVHQNARLLHLAAKTVDAFRLPCRQNEAD
jgi:hypothetical protein